jgi:hypothetical protein
MQRTSVSTLDQCPMPLILGAICFFLARFGGGASLFWSPCAAKTPSSDGSGIWDLAPRPRPRAVRLRGEARTGPRAPIENAWVRPCDG